MTLMQKYAAPVLLLLVAIHHAYRVERDQLTTWKGGGFGMFASLDQQRFARIYVSRGAQFYPVHGPSHGTGIDLYRRALAIPSRERAVKLASELDRHWKLPDDRQAVVATFRMHYDASTPPRLVAESVHMVSSKPALSGNGLQWRW